VPASQLDFVRKIAAISIIPSLYGTGQRSYFDPAGRPRTPMWGGGTMAPLLTMRGIVKQFPGVRALD
jgi:hypothetical protein